jgi:signal transduction histidine kinase
MRAMGPGGGGGGPGGGPRGGRWVLQLKHTAGSLDRAVQTLRYKNLGISFVILLLMGITIGAFVDSTRRARQLALQQMEFVASISHELRTPLTVICSAGDNLAGGVVKNESQVKRYGNLIRSEGRRLTDMVEQILGYAGIQKGRLPAPQPVEVESIVDSALKACGQLIESSGCAVEREVETGLLQISGDAASLSHSLQNLITNAVKYGGNWLRVTASASGEKWIRITVEDHGPGIEPKELRHIFEPFYR